MNPPACLRWRARFPQATSSIWISTALKPCPSWCWAKKKLLVCDTTMRDAHQSLLATRVRSRDMIRAADGTAKILKDCFSLEMWGRRHLSTWPTASCTNLLGTAGCTAQSHPQHTFPDAPSRRQRGGLLQLP